MTKHRSPSLLGFSFCMFLSWIMSASPLHAQDVTVTSATPSTATQGTVSLDVTIGGSGFKKGAKAQWFITGTTNPGGITVNSTAFVNSTTLVANITVAADAQTDLKFDIAVASGGRTGKGIELFSVAKSSGSNGCTTLGTPSSSTLATTLNYVNSSNAPQYQPHLGTALSVRPVELTNGVDSRAVLVAAVASGNSNGKMEFFFLDPATGQVIDGQVLVGTNNQPHITVFFDPTQMAGVGKIAAGDLNSDGIPDFVAGNNASHAYVFVGSMDADGILSYRFFSLSPPASNPGNYASSVAMGKLDGSSAGDEVVVGALGTGGKKGMPGVVYAYRFNGSGFDLIGTVDDPLHNNADQFGSSVAIGDVTGDGVPDLVVGAPYVTVGSATNAGMVSVFPSPLTSTTYFTLTTGISGDSIGVKLGSGMLSSATATDVIATSNSSSNPRVVLFSGPITGNRTASSFDFLAYPVLTLGWATSADAGDMTGDGRSEVLVGAPNAVNSNSCSSSVGAAHLFLSNPSNPSQPTLTIFQPPTLDPNFGGFGYSVGLAPFTFGNPPILLVGENGRDLGGVTGAGQVYVYRKN